jgi:hypothetical protein
LKRPDRIETIRKTRRGDDLGQSASARILETKVKFKGSLSWEHQTTRVTRAMQDNATFWLCSTRPQEFHDKVIETGRTTLGDTNLILLSRR